MKKILFLDRDGVINYDSGGYVYKIEDFKFNPSVFPFLQALRDEGFVFIIVTNQGGISKGLYKKEDVDKLHEYMCNEFKRNGIEILDIFYCPHHSDLEKCLCRKPDSLMVERALAKHNLSAKDAYLIGDKQRDCDSGEKVGVKGIKIEPNSDLMQALIKFN